MADQFTQHNHRMGKTMADTKEIPVAFTSDGKRIVIGMTVWTNNYREATVTRFLHSETNQTTGTVAHWFDTTDCMADGSRMSARRPF